jgi:hypothetical protein
MPELKNVDDVLVKSMNEQLAANNQPTIPEPMPKAIEVPATAPDDAADDYGIDVKHPETAKIEAVSADKPQKAESDAPIDEYGNPVEKPKMYTQDEVNEIVRERFSRGRWADEQNKQAQQQAKKDAEGFTPDPNSEEPWQEQLEQFIDQAIDKRQRKQTQAEWQREESIRQAEFEEKFSAGMNKYQDFKQVVSGKPITDTMMLAARNLENPAAFIYAAAKMHPKELERISQIKDSYIQASEVGRLHEKMVRSASSVSKAPKPIDVPKGDMAPKSLAQPSLEERIHSYGKQKMGRR